MLGKQRSFLESELPEVPELLSKRKLWHHRSRRGFSDQNPIGCSPSKSSTATKRAHNQSIFYSPHPLTHSITPLAAALLLPLSQQLSRVLTAASQMLHSSMVLTSSETDCFELSLIGFQKSIYFVILHTYI